MKTKKDQWAEEWVETQIFRNRIAGAELPNVEDVFKAGFDKAINELLAKGKETFVPEFKGLSYPTITITHAEIEKLGSEPSEQE